MTTKVSVEAHHGWPVDVKAISPETGEYIDTYSVRIEAGATHAFYIHSGMDVRIHEVQPGEIAAEPASADASAAG